jgi:hypothetical protein
MREPLEKFGAFLVRNLRDKMLFDLDMLLRGAWKAPGLQERQKRVSDFSDAEKQVVSDVVESIIRAGMHDLLLALQEEADNAGSVRVLVDGEEVAKLSDGLQAEPFGEDGWIVRYSEYPSQTDIDLSRWATEQIQKMFGDKGPEKG